ncbi:MAG: hypothetical protein OEX23_00355 [Betaproteobacteria bacterium]|nr:hypothetical protein [Betaproteobacteria bacterium]
MPRPPAPADRAVRYGGWLFSVPASFADAAAPRCAGLFAVQVLNAAWSPCPFEPIYFGHAQSLQGSVVATHPSYGRWIAHPRAGTGLYVAYAALPCTAVDTLRRIVAALVESYRPVANRNEGPAPGLLGLAGERRSAA